MGRLLEASGLTELSINPTISSTNVLAYQSDSYWNENRFSGSMRDYLVCRTNLSMLVSRKFVL